MINLLKNYKTPLAANPKIEPIPNRCPKQLAPTNAPWLKPPKNLAFGIAKPSFGFLIVALAIAYARILHEIITRAHFGDQW